MIRHRPPTRRILILALHASSLAFLSFGLWGVASPETMLSFVGLHDIGSEAAVEFRAYYGGLEIGFAIFLQYCARHPAFALPALWAATSIFTGCAVVRLVGIAVTTCYSWPLVLSFLGEAAFAIMTGIIGGLECKRQKVESSF